MVEVAPIGESLMMIWSSMWSINLLGRQGDNFDIYNNARGWERPKIAYGAILKYMIVCGLVEYLALDTI